MQLSVTGHHVDITPSLRTYMEKKFERLARHFDHVIDVHCVLTVEKLRQKAEVGSSRVDLQACKLEYSIVSPK